MMHILNNKDLSNDVYQQKKEINHKADTLTQFKSNHIDIDI